MQLTSGTMAGGHGRPKLRWRSFVTGKVRTNSSCPDEMFDPTTFPEGIGKLRNPQRSPLVRAVFSSALVTKPKPASSGL